ncbi:MAG TPA: YjjG family noncanonical pyrimidine nucleotidase, partial [Bdellovibrionales bacterium]|nr:YjjG family noncanonical pyrimidine nucleotidase [Bdellovibrionales bacterium]
MSYKLFLFDADDTLFDFGASERSALARTFIDCGVSENFETLYQTYREESVRLWQQVEKGEISKDFLRSERFRLTFAKHALSHSAEEAGARYLELLPETVVMIDHAADICRYLRTRGEIGIITNGFETVQMRRLKNSPIAEFISFTVVSEVAGFTKPDIRFFEYTAKQVKDFSKTETLVIGDRIETDVQGAHN